MISLPGLDRLDRPVLIAPMAGGPTTPELVLAAAAAGSGGFLAAGYLSPDQLAEQRRAVRAAGDAAPVNVFAPSPMPVDEDAVRRYRDSLGPEADRYEVILPELADVLGDPGDDHLQDKIDLLVDNPASVVSFTFAIPDRVVLRRLQAAGSAVWCTVCSAAEAVAASEAGADALVVQGGAAGGHSGTSDPADFTGAEGVDDLLAEIRTRVAMPMIAAGGIADSAAVHRVQRAGATAVLAGTAFLLAAEAGTKPAHCAALTDPDRFADTVLTRAFTGRPARGLRNRFTETHTAAPLAYPALHHLTSPLRRAAAERGDPDGLHLWAGQNFRRARTAPAAEILDDLTDS